MVDSKQQWKAWLYLLPAIILLLVFTVWPIINTVRIAFLEGYSPLAGILDDSQFPIGIGNFIKVVSRESFSTALTNTLMLTVITVPISCFLALIVSVFLNSIPRFSSLFQTIYFLPYVTNSIAIGMVFAMMFNIIGYRTVEVANAGGYDVYNTFLMEKVVGYTPEGEAIKELVEYGKIADSWGIVNNLIIALGGEPISWINHESTIISNYVVLVVYIVWNALPMKILILLGGLQSVNQQYYDAAKIDGTSPIRTFWCITVPLLSPMIAYTVITSFIGGFKEYSSIVGIFDEAMGPPGGDGRLNTIVGYIYKAISGDDYGIASAAALILFGIILVVTLINLYVSSKKVHY